jgi:tetratricopeptide (TPR) repeat protein
MSIERVVAIAIAAALSACGRPSSLSDPQRDREAEAMQREGAALLEARRLDEAGMRLQAAYERHVKIADHREASVDARLISRRYFLGSQYRDALRWGDRARGEALASGDAELLGEAHLSLARIFRAVGDVTGEEEASAEAVRHLPESDKAGRATLLVYEGLRMRARGRSAQAEQLQEEARDLAREAGDHYTVQSACANLADIALAAHRLDDAARHLRDAWAAWRLRVNPPRSAGILINESILARERGELAAARRALDEAAVNAAPDTAWPIDWHRGLVAEAAGQRDEAEKRYRAAIRVVEQLRVTSAPADAAQLFEENRWRPYESLFALQLDRGDARAAFATLVQAQGRVFLDVLAASLTGVRGQSRSQIENAIARMDGFDQLVPELARSPLGRPFQPDAILRALRDKVVVAYFAGAGRMRMIAVVGGIPRITGVDVPLDRLDQMVDRFRSSPEDGDAAAELGAALLPAGALPRSPARVHVVPTGVLVPVAFAALRVSGQRLLDRHEVAYAPSVTGLAAIAAAAPEDGSPPVVIADTRRKLAAGDRELRAVVAATGARAHLGPQATPAALRRAADASLLHVISHSAVRPRGGYLVLAGGQEVTAADIVAWRLHPRLVVLTTCASAATSGMEMWGSLAAAFLAAGSIDVVATLASVEDRVAADFTELFYRLGGASDPVGAVTRAQRAMAQQGRPVADWRPFVAVGL